MVYLKSDEIDITEDISDGVVIEVAVRGNKQNIPKRSLQLLSPLVSSILRTIAPCINTVIIIPDVSDETFEDFLQVIQNFTNTGFQKVMSEHQVRRLDDIFELLKINTNFFKINLVKKEEERSTNSQEKNIVHANSTGTENFKTGIDESSIEYYESNAKEESETDISFKDVSATTIIDPEVRDEDKELKSNSTGLKDMFDFNDELPDPKIHPIFLSSDKRNKKKKSKLGRPLRKHPHKITEIVTEEDLSLYTDEEIQSLKYRRIRDLNNEASRKCRAARRDKQLVLEEYLLWEQNRNEKLRFALKEKMKKMDVFKNYMYKLGVIKPKKSY